MKKLLLFLRTVGRHFVNDGCFHRASALAYTSLLAVVPLMAIGLVALSYFPLGHLLSKQVENFIFHNLVASSGEELQVYLAGFSQQASRMSWFGIVALIIVIVMLLFSMENAFNCIWKLPMRPGRFAVLRSLLRQWLTLILVPLLLILSLVFSTYFSPWTLINHLFSYAHLPSISLYIFPFLFVFFAFTVMYKFIPATKVYWRDAIVGAVIGTVLFQISKKLFVVYIYFFPTYRILYGAFAAIPLFLIWIYFVWLVVLFAAEISWLLGKQRTTVD